MSIGSKKLEKEIAELRDQIINHKVYSEINTIDDLKIFMEYHVYAVWDFMSLLKSLQLELTCTEVPWFPKENGATSYLINEIVVGEESDVDFEGNRKSHYEMYLDAMLDVGARLGPIKTFVSNLSKGKGFETSFIESGAPAEAKNMVTTTFKAIDSHKPHIQAAVFTFGREDLIPSMFVAIIKDIYKSDPDKMQKFMYYLERHIEVDGGHHSELALQMTNDLCGTDEKKWEEATTFVKKALEARIKLWDGVKDEIMKKRD